MECFAESGNGSKPSLEPHRLGLLMCLRVLCDPVQPQRNASSRPCSILVTECYGRMQPTLAMVLLLLSDRDPLSHAGLGIFHAFARGPYSKCNKDDGKQIQSRKTSLNGKIRVTPYNLGPWGP